MLLFIISVTMMVVIATMTEDMIMLIFGITISMMVVIFVTMHVIIKLHYHHSQYHNTVILPSAVTMLYLFKLSKVVL